MLLVLVVTLYPSQETLTQPLHELLGCAECPMSWLKTRRTLPVETLSQDFKEQFSLLWTELQFSQLGLLLKNNDNILTIK